MIFVAVVVVVVVVVVVAVVVATVSPIRLIDFSQFAFGALNDIPVCEKRQPVCFCAPAGNPRNSSGQNGLS